MTFTSSTTLPVLSGRHLAPRQAGQPLGAIKRATCYVNAAVQALVHIPAVANLRVQDWRKSCGCKPDSKGFCTLCYFGIRVQSSFGKGPETAAKKPLGMLQRLHLLSGSFLGSTHNSRRKAPSGNTTEVDISTREFSMEDCAEFVGQWMQNARLQELNNRQACNEVSTSLIDHLFGSFTTTCCLSACCGFASPRACEEARLLLLPIKECRIQKPADAGAVRDTLPEMLDRWAHGTENNETCGKCGRRGEASCAKHIWQAPNVLVIDVQRNLTGIIKEEGVVTFPEVLDLSAWLAHDSPEHHAPGGVVYDCVSMVGHAGSIQGGHYIAHCRDGLGEGNAPGAWHVFNDDKRKGTTFEEVSQKPASLLVYSRQQPRQEPLLPSAANNPLSSPTAIPPPPTSQVAQLSNSICSSVAGSAGSASTAFPPSLSADGNAEAPGLDNHLTAGRLQPGCSAGSDTGGITEPSASDVPSDQLHSCAPLLTCTDAVLKRQPSPAESDHSDQSVQESANHPAGPVLPFKGHMQTQSTGLHMTDDGGAKLGKRARKRPNTLTDTNDINRLKKPKLGKIEEPAASAGSTRQRQNDKPKGNSKSKLQTGSKRQLQVKTKASTLPPPTSLLQPEGLRRSARLKRKAEGMEDAETDVIAGQPNKRAHMAVNATSIDEEQPEAVLSADAALDSECSNVMLKTAAVLSADAAPSLGCSNARQKTVGKGAAKQNLGKKKTTKRRLHRASGVLVACNVLNTK